jgi:hypothetical protein
VDNHDDNVSLAVRKSDKEVVIIVYVMLLFLSSFPIHSSFDPMSLSVRSSTHTDECSHLHIYIISLGILFRTQLIAASVTVAVTAVAAAAAAVPVAAAVAATAAAAAVAAVAVAVSAVEV